MRGDVLKACDLLILCRQVADRVEDEVGERERSLDRACGEIADRHVDVLGTRLRAKSRYHRLREVDSVHADAAPRERQRDSARADPELERGAVAGQIGQEFDGGIDDGTLEHVGSGLVVVLGNVLTEVIFGHSCTLPQPSPFPSSFILLMTTRPPASPRSAGSMLEVTQGPPC
jgi:hypothetical protein